LIEHSKAQSFGSTYHHSRPFECREIVTVAHGTATLSETMAAVEAYYEELGQEVSRPLYTLELTVVHLDEHEYQEVNLPEKWSRRDMNE